MQGIILAAGMGKRLLPLTKHKPKAMVKVLGKPILEYVMEGLARKQISEIIIVVGYCKDAIINYFGDNYKGVRITYVHNDDYNKTNNIYSLKLGLEKIKEDFILCEGDVVFEPKMLDFIKENSNKNLVFVSKYQSYMDGTVVKYNKSSKRITELITGANQGESYDYSEAYKTINLYYLTYDFLQKHFKPTLELYLTNHDMSGYYEIILGALLYMDNEDLYACEIDKLKWFEIDDANDMEMAEYIFSKDKLNLIDKQYGGYWRYEFLDFCYLFNCYFPNKNFYSKLGHDLPQLINNYPSGHAKLNKMLATWYKEDSFHPDNLIIGNGTSEIIRIINKTIVKKITIPLPTFNEYENKLDESQINYFVLPKDKGFQLIKEDFVKSIKDSNSNVALIINPNNPTGGIITKQEIAWILEQITEVVVIVDESFIDFSGDREKYSAQDLVNEYPNLVILRSISKEFGVPGIRLGYILTENKLVKNTIMKNLPIWNINSIAEYFIENFGNYQKSYEKSIQKMIADRNEFHQNLSKINYLKILPSHANFFFGEVEGSAQMLKEKLFSDYKILIKNCSNKKPLENDNYVRISLKNKEDNNKLIAALMSLRKNHLIETQQTEWR